MVCACACLRVFVTVCVHMYNVCPISCGSRCQIISRKIGPVWTRQKAAPVRSAVGGMKKLVTVMLSESLSLSTPWYSGTSGGRRRGVGGVLEVVRPKVGAAEGRVGGGGGGGAGDLPRENFVKKTQNPAFWELLAQCAVESSTVVSVLSTTADV